jgi:hypothetical protein
MRHVLCSLALAVATWGTAASAPAQDVMIDRVLATVDTHVITLSDVRGVRALGLVAAGTPGEATGAVLDALIDRRLVLAEVERYQPPEPDPAAVERGVAAVRAAHAASYESALLTSGLDEGFVRQWVRNELRIETYIAQRFAGGRSTRQPSASRSRPNGATHSCGSGSTDCAPARASPGRRAPDEPLCRPTPWAGLQPWSGVTTTARVALARASSCA